MNENKRLVVYGVPFSQPVRAVLWLLINRKHPFQLELITPGSKGERGSRNSAYLDVNAAGTIPAIREPDTGFTLGEANAIMTYLCSRHGWTDMYPEDLQQRALVDQYLHYHHRYVRAASGLVAPKVRKDLNISEAAQAESLRIVTAGIRLLDGRRLAQNKFVAGARVTVADLAAYAEVGQLQSRYTNLFDFSPYPNLERWLADMAQVDGHDAVHIVLAELGDISEQAPSMESLKNANVTALRGLKALLATFTS